MDKVEFEATAFTCKDRCSANWATDLYKYLNVVFRYTVVAHVWRLLISVAISKWCARFSPNIQSYHFSTGRSSSSLRHSIARYSKRGYSTHVTISLSKITLIDTLKIAAFDSAANILSRPATESSSITTIHIHCSHISHSSTQLSTTGISIYNPMFLELVTPSFAKINPSSIANLGALLLTSFDSLQLV